MKLKLRLLLVSCFVFSLSLPVLAQSKASEGNSEEAPWLDIGVEHRTRYETLDNRFRLGETGSDQQLPQRTRVHFELNRVIDPLSFVVEFEDARVHLNDSGSTVTNTMEDENDITQLYMRYTMKPLGKSKIPSVFYFGRQGIDLGSRRFVARNSFRNTTNAFDAVRWVLGNGKRWQLTTFLSRPVLRRMHRPDMPDHTGAFWGSFLSLKMTPLFNNEFYYYGLRESMTSPASLKRQYSTIGTRIYKSPKAGKVSYEFETALQFGKKAKLDQLAHFEHASADYTFNAPWQPRITGRYDYASGTKNPSGEDYNTFDTLYGARRFEFGPTGIYGPFSRSNISSPGVAVYLNPNKKIKLYSSLRWVWLAQARDQWVGSKLKDTTGKAGSYLGSQVEFQVAYNISKHIQPEIGYARFIKGSYLNLVPRSPGTEDSNYFYVQTNFVFDHLIRIR